MRRFPWAFAALNLAVICFHINLFGGWNQVSRPLPLLSLVEEGTLQIDARHELTGDKAFIGGHYYSEKAPATTFLALPLYALARAALAGSRYAVEGPRAASGAAVSDAILVGTLVCSALPFLAILLIFVSRLQAVAGPGAVASPRLIAVWLLYGTYVFVYADYFFGGVLRRIPVPRRAGRLGSAVCRRPPDARRRPAGGGGSARSAGGAHLQLRHHGKRADACLQIRFILWAAAFAAVLQALRGRRPSPVPAAGAVASLPSPAA